MKWSLCLIAMLFTGCDSVYHYVVYPPQRIEYVLVPDSALTKKFLNSSEYVISEDGKSISFDRKDFKVEVKYISDYQLNTIEFPEQSNSGYYSTNPFTYGNWIDPELGYTPNRFTVFKVTIYNYSASKINFDPESAVLESERGDKFYCYGREEKSSRNQSLEAYYKKRKGTSGVDDDVFESRMGIIRRTVHYLGKPVFKNDMRDGLIVFDPLTDDAGRVKLTLKDFILGYDENNQPSEFTTLNFYFDRVARDIGQQFGTDSVSRQTVEILASDAIPSGKATIGVRTSNVLPIEQLMQPVENYFAEYTNFTTHYEKTDLAKHELEKSNIVLILAGEDQISFLPEYETSMAEFIKKGGFVIADVFATNENNRNWSSINNFFGNVAEQLNGKLYISRVPSDHIIYRVWKKFDALPPVDSDLFNMQQKSEVETREKVYEFLMGLYYENKLIGILSNRGYSIAWGEFYPAEFRQGKDFTRSRELLGNFIYYATQIQKK
ncbi:MAG: hypothetical protein AB1600_06390 [Bacteroidota bacterium]